jgi:hypothetical protein
MSDNNTNKKNTPQQTKVQATEYEQGRQSLKAGLNKTATRYGEISQMSSPHTPRDAAVQLGQSALAGGKEFGKAAGHFGKGFIEGVSQQTGDKTPAANRAITNYAITQGRTSANKPAENKGIAAARQKTAISPPSVKTEQTSSSTNKGIASFQSKASGQSSSTAKGSTSSVSKGSSSSSGGQSSDSSKESSR